MDKKLVAWARGVKARRGKLRGHRGKVDCPPLWLFTDERRLPDPRGAARRLPRGLAGIVLRHDSDPHRETLGADLRRICRDRRLVLVVAGDARLAWRLGAGLHLRDGRRPGLASALGRLQRAGRVMTSSAHGTAAILRAARLGAAAIFLSPFAATATHPTVVPLGPVRWSALARRAPGRMAALGGVDNVTVQLVSPDTIGIGAIAALS